MSPQAGGTSVLLETFCTARQHQTLPVSSPRRRQRKKASILNALGYADTTFGNPEHAEGNVPGLAG